jgi:hypothetical protein
MNRKKHKNVHQSAMQAVPEISVPIPESDADPDDIDLEDVEGHTSTQNGTAENDLDLSASNNLHPNRDPSMKVKKPQKLKPMKKSNEAAKNKNAKKSKDGDEE